MPALANTSLVGRFPPPKVPGRGLAGERVVFGFPMDASRFEGPMEARALGVLPPPPGLLFPWLLLADGLPPGPGDGDGDGL
jgi:hypothetical protein